MDRKTFGDQCRAVGLKLIGNKVTQGIYTYGEADDSFFSGGDNPDILLKDADYMAYVEAEHLLTILMLDGTAYSYRGRIEEPEEAAPRAMPTSVSDLDDMFDIIFPNHRERLYYDVMREQGMVDPTLFDMPAEETEFIAINDDIYPFYYGALERKLRSLGCTGRYPGIQTRDLVLKKKLIENKRNLFREWVESHEWDGKERLGRWFIDGLGATAPPLEAIHKDQVYLEGVTTAWFMGGIQRMFQEAKTEVVPVLIGGEGIGKGNFLRYTAAFNDDWFIDTSAQLKGPGAEEKFLESITGSIIVELSESTQFSTPEGTELLKSFVSKSRDKHRKAYARETTSTIRRFMLVATSNRNNIFIDVGGGNRRYFPMYCDPNKAIMPYDPLYKVVGRYEVEQVWAEALAKYKAHDGSESFINAELADLAREMQEYGTIENTNVNQIDQWLNDPEHGFEKVGSRITKDEILYEVFGIPTGSGCLVPAAVEMAYRNWSSIQKCWRKLQRPVSFGGKTVRNVYERVYTESESMIKRRSNMVNVVPGTEARFIDVIGIIRSRAEKFHYKDNGDIFPVAGLSGEELQALLDSGYIEQDAPGQYTLVCMP